MSEMAHGPSSNVRVIEGRVSRKFTTNALLMTFHDSPGDPAATAAQGGADGFGRKMGVLFGFKNGGIGTHLLTLGGRTELHIESRELQPTIITHADGSVLASIVRGEVSVASDPRGNEILRIIDDPDNAKSPDAFRLRILSTTGAQLGRLNLIRTLAGWSLGWELYEDAVWWGRAGQPLKLPFLGTSIVVEQPLTDEQHTVLLCACVDMAIGLRPYGTAMDSPRRKVPAKDFESP